MSVRGRKRNKSADTAVVLIGADPSSSVFLDMTRAARDTSHDTPMHLDVNETEMQQFLSPLKGHWSSDPVYGTAWPGPLLPSMIDLAIQFDCVPIINIITLMLTDCNDHIEAWTLFVVASKLDSLYLAKRAIQRFTPTDYDWTGGMADGRKLYKSGIDDRYTVGLVTAALTCWSRSSVENVRSRTKKMTPSLTPTLIAAAFEVAAL